MSSLKLEGRNSIFVTARLGFNNPAHRAFNYMRRNMYKDLAAKDTIVLTIGTGSLPPSQIGNFKRRQAGLGLQWCQASNQAERE